MKRLLKISKSSLSPLKGLRIYVLIVALVQISVSMLKPYLIGELVDSLTEPLYIITRMSAVLLILLLANFFLNWYQNYLWFKMIHKGTACLRSELFKEVIKNPYTFWCKNDKGDIVNRLMNDASMYSQRVLISALMLILNISRLALSLGFIFCLNYFIGIAVLIICVVYFFSYKHINIRLRKHGTEERQSYSELLHTTTNLYEGLPSIKLYLQESHFSKRYSEKVKSLSQKNIALQLWVSLSQSLSSLIIDFMPVAAVVLGAYLASRGLCTIGAIFGIYAYTSYLGEPIRNLTDYNLALQQGKVTEARIEEILPVDETETDSRKNDIPDISELSLSDVSFSYDGQSNILEHFNLNIKRGERIGIVGSSGAGKTTLIRLLTGQLEPSSGNIAVNSQSLKALSREAYYKRIAVLPQEVFLYDDTVTNNILFGREIGAEKQSCLAKVLGINDFMGRKITELSGGERKRVGLARTLAGEFDLLILDEPTSDVDEAMEKRIVSFIDETVRECGRMLIVITHRPAILEICDRVIRLGGADTEADLQQQ